MGFGQVAAWSTVTVDTIAEKKKVVFRPSSSTDKVRVGDLVCYNSDLAANWQEKTSARAANDLNGSGVTTYAEGSQTFNARFLVVEKPATANLHAFAGVVAELGPERGGDGDTISVFVPKVGAVVPVYTDQSVTVDSSVLTVANGSYMATAAGNPIGVAVETIDRSSPNGLAWMRMIAGQTELINGGVVSYLGTSAAVGSNRRGSFAHTAGYSAQELIFTTFTGTIASTGGGSALITYLSIDGSITATTSYTRTLLSQLVLTGTINGSNAHLAAGHFQLGGSPTFTACSKISALWADIGLGVTPTSGDVNGLRISNNGANQTEVTHGIELYGGYGINYLFNFDTCAGITGNFISNGGTGGATKVITSGGDWKKVKVKIDGSDFFMLAMVDPVEVDKT